MTSNPLSEENRKTLERVFAPTEFDTFNNMNLVTMIQMYRLMNAVREECQDHVADAGKMIAPPAQDDLRERLQMRAVHMRNAFSGGENAALTPEEALAHANDLDAILATLRPAPTIPAEVEGLVEKLIRWANTEANQEEDILEEAAQTLRAQAVQLAEERNRYRIERDMWIAEDAALTAQRDALQATVARLRGRLIAYLGEFIPRCYPDTAGSSRRTAFEEVRDLLTLTPDEFEDRYSWRAALKETEAG